MLKIDMHVHTNRSGDAVNEPRDIIKQAKKAGLNRVGITDHNTIRGALEVLKEAKKEGLGIIIGCEIKTAEKGEILGYFLNSEIKSKNTLEVIDELRAQDAFISIPHPFDMFRRRTKITKELAEKIHAVEVFNSRCILNYFNQKALDAAKENNLALTAGSDAHEINSIGMAGVFVNSMSEEELRKELFSNSSFFGERLSLLFLGKRLAKRIVLKKLKRIF